MGTNTNTSDLHTFTVFSYSREATEKAAYVMALGSSLSVQHNHMIPILEIGNMSFQILKVKFTGGNEEFKNVIDAF